MSKSIVIGFDFDGTLVDSKDAVCSALAETLPHFLHPEENWSVEDVFHLNLESLRTKYRFRDEKGFDAFRQNFVEVFDKKYFKNVLLIEGARELLDNLVTRYGSSQLFILTNRRIESVTQIAREVGVVSYFHFIQSTVPNGTSNPKVQALNSALRRYEKPFWSAYIGDHTHDVDAAFENGATAILFNPLMTTPHHPHALHIGALKDIIDIVEINHEPR